MMPTNNPANDFVACLERGCTAWRRGDDFEGVSWFQQACILWLDTLEANSLEDTAIPSETLEQITHWLGEAMNYLEIANIIRATDIIEYHIVPLVKSASGSEKE